MSASESSCSQQEAFPFDEAEPFISRSDIIELYQSRYCVLVPFDCIEPSPFPCSFGNKDPMPKEHARRLYGFNQAVTMLETRSGKMQLLDGSRCFPEWQKGVQKGELPCTAFMNVITPTRSLTDVQILQLSVYCNIRSRDTRMRTLWEKVYICHALYATVGRAQRDRRAASPNVLCYDKKRGKRSIILTVAKGLYISCLFDHCVLEQARRWDPNRIESFVENTVRICIYLCVEEELLQAIKLSYVETPQASKTYFRRQFFLDYDEGWFRSAPLLKQLLLLFTLPSFPHLPFCDLTPEDTITKTIRGKMRKRVPKVCEEICLSLCTTAFEIVETRNATGSENNTPQQSSHDEDSSELSVPLIQEIGFDIVMVIKEAEFNLLDGNAEAIQGRLGNYLTTNAKERIKKRPFTVSHESLTIILK